jgi:hypothetical protein
MGWDAYIDNSGVPDTIPVESRHELIDTCFVVGGDVAHIRRELALQLRGLRKDVTKRHVGVQGDVERGLIPLVGGAEALGRLCKLRRRRHDDVRQEHRRVKQRGAGHKVRGERGVRQLPRPRLAEEIARHHHARDTTQLRLWHYGDLGDLRIQHRALQGDAGQHVEMT